MSKDNVESASEGTIEDERAELQEINQRGLVGRLGGYSKKCGPGWLQSAITLGGGSLGGALYLGVIGGTSFMWIQPLAMVLGVIMLSAIAYVTLSSGRRPFRAINEHVSPVLGWGWILATIAANIVWCLPQFSLAFFAVSKNILPGVGDSLGAKCLVSGVILTFAVIIVWSYGSGSKGIKFFELFLKLMVGFIVLSFVGVVVMLTISKDSSLSWVEVFKGFVPDFGALFRPADAFVPLVAETADPTHWQNTIVDAQRDNIMAAFATAVGINMTFLLPYSMLKRGWGKEHRGLAIFDLSTGLFIPFVVATGCLVIAAATQFHDTNLKPSESKTLTAKFAGSELATPDEKKAFDDNPTAFKDRLLAFQATLPANEKAETTIEMMLAKRDQWELASALEPIAGKEVSQYIFGLGVLAMGVSTIVILMLINGFAFCEIKNVAPSGTTFRIGTLVAGVAGFFGPILWGHLNAYLVVPTSVFGLTLLPIAYVAFFLMMNSKSLMGENIPTGARKIRWNILMLIATLVATFGASWAIHSKLGWAGIAILAGLFILVAVTYRGNKAHPAE